MAKLNLSIAVRDYDRTRPLSDGLVQIDGVDPVYMALDPEEIFFRAFRRAEFDICELSMSSFTVKTAQGNCPYVGVPAFVSRAFRHTSIYVRTDRIQKPADLKGKKIGVPEYQLTANVWARAILEDDHGVRPSDIHWFRGGLTETGRREKISITLPKGVRLDDIPEGRTLSSMLDAGEIDGFIGPRVPPGFERGDPKIGWLFPDPVAAAKDYYKRTGIFPIMHLVVVERRRYEADPSLAVALLEAFVESKRRGLAVLADAEVEAVADPWWSERTAELDRLFGGDPFPYGLERNRAVLEAAVGYAVEQGLVERRLDVTELFAAETRKHPGG
jgi:4,5-dihydroxyphthalate decarboxylase